MEKSLQKGFKSADIPLLIIDTDGILLFSNEAAAEALELKDSAEGEKFVKQVEFFDDANNKIKEEDLPFIVSTKEKKSLTDRKVKFINSAEKELWFSCNTIYLNSVDDQSPQVFFSLRDITNTAQIENWFRETADNIGSVLYSTDAEGKQYNFVSEAAFRIFGYKQEDIIANRVSLIRKIDPAYLSEFKSFIKKLRDGKEAKVEYKFYDANGKELFVRHYGYPVKENNEIVRIVGSITNVTDEIEYRSKLEKSEERFRVLIETAEDLIFTLNSYGYFITVNTRGARTLGFTPDELIGKHFLEFVNEENKADFAVSF